MTSKKLAAKLPTLPADQHWRITPSTFETERARVRVELVQEQRANLFERLARFDWNLTWLVPLDASAYVDAEDRKIVEAAQDILAARADQVEAKARIREVAGVYYTPAGTK